MIIFLILNMHLSVKLGNKFAIWVHTHTKDHILRTERSSRSPSSWRCITTVCTCLNQQNQQLPQHNCGSCMLPSVFGASERFCLTTYFTPAEPDPYLDLPHITPALDYTCWNVDIFLNLNLEMEPLMFYWFAQMRITHWCYQFIYSFT